MKTVLSVALAAALVAPVSGCAIVMQAPVVPPLGFVYSNVDAPLDLDIDGTPVESRRGESSTTTILGLFTFGDASVKAAADEGGLTTIESADYNYFSILGMYQRYTTIVYGK